MKKYTVELLIISIFNFYIQSSIAKIANPTEFHLAPGVMVKILDWDSVLKTFTLESETMPGEGEFEVSVEDFANANSSLSLNEILKKPDSLVRIKFILVKNLNIMSENDIKKRRNEIERLQYSSRKKSFIKQAIHNKI
jgi:hypothetical protein